MNPLIQSKNTTILPVLIALALACFAPVSQVRATCQEGCLTNQNTVLGDDALLNNTNGSSNTAVGSDALALNTDGFDNTAVGNGALFANTNGSFNTATGRGALQSNATGHKNTADGGFALYLNTTGSFNTATGTEALYFNTTGSSNIALGYQAGQRLTTGSNNIDIGNDGHVGESSTIRIGTARTQTNAYVAGISGVTVPTGVPVIVDSSGHLGTTTSSASFKEAIKPMNKASEAILALQPVTFHYKKDLDPYGIPQFGLVAEDVEKVNPDLVARDEQGKPYTVRYDAVNAMLLNEFLKEHRKVESLEKAMAEQQKENAAMRAMLKGQAAQIQMVSARLAAASPSRAGLEVNKRAQQTVVSNQ